jgi:hypothetical protein
LPEFRRKEMLKPSSSRTHAFNEALLGLKHYAFGLLLVAKCRLLGKTLVVWSHGCEVDKFHFWEVVVTEVVLE